MNIENVKQIFGSPVVGSEKSTNKNILLPIIFISLIGLALYLRIKENKKRDVDEHN